MAVRSFGAAVVLALGVLMVSGLRGQGQAAPNFTFATLRSQCDAAADKWSGAGLFQAEIRLSARPLWTCWYHAASTSNAAQWTQVMTIMGGSARVPPRVEPRGGYGPVPPTAPANVMEPLAGFQKMGITVDHLMIEDPNRIVMLGQVGFPYSKVAPSNLSIALPALEKYGKRGEWVWYTVNSLGRQFVRLVFFNAVTGQGSSVCMPVGTSLTSQPCPPLGTAPTFERRPVIR